MFDIGWTELLVIAIVLIVVVGPKDLPPMLRAFGKMTSNLRKMASDFRTQFDQALREADMDDVRQTISDAQRFHPANAIREAINPLKQMGEEIRSDLNRATAAPEVPVEQHAALPSESLPPLGTASATGPTASAPATPASQQAPVATTPAAATVAAPVTAAASAPATSAPASGAVEDAKAKKPRAPRKPKATEASVVTAEPVSEAAPVVKRTRAAKVAVVQDATPVAATPVEAKPKRARTPKVVASPSEAVKAEKTSVAAAPRSRKKTETPKDSA